MLFGLIAWSVFSFKVSAAIAGATGSRLAKAAVAIAMFATLLVAPIADDLLGNWQYKRYCKAGDKVAYLGTISVSPDVGLFTANGDWKIANLGPSDGAERSRLGNLAESFVRWENGIGTRAGSVFPIEEQETRIIDRSSGTLVAKWTSYHFRGGFLRRGFLDSASQCFPTEFHNDLYRRIFVLERR